MGICSFGRQLWGAVSMGICSFGRQLWALFGELCHGDLQLWSAVMGLVWGAVSMGISSFGWQSWALLGEPCPKEFAALVGSYGPCLGSRVYGD